MTYGRQLACGGIAAGVLLAGQTAAQSAPQFDVASVKPAVAPRGTAMILRGGNSRDSALRMSGTRLTTQGTLTTLLLAAYELRSYQLSGEATVPDAGGRDQIYVVDARTPGDTAPAMDQVRVMLQNLLVERFQVRFHREAKEIDAYDLVVGPAGVKFQASAPDAETTFDSQFATDQTIRYRYANLTVWQLAARLSGEFDRPLVDKTGLAGPYDFTLAFTPHHAGNLTPEGAALIERMLGPEDDGKSVVSALRKQLGLNVIRAKERVEMLVIDHAEKPADN